MIAFTMSHRKKSSFCAKLFKAFRVILVALFGVQATLLYFAQRSIELPDFVCKWAAEKLAPEGTHLEIGGGSLKHLAFLELRKISLAHASSSEPTLTLNTAGAYFNWKNIVNPNKNVQTFFFDGIRLRCPASLSQTGKPEVVLADGRINAAYSFGEIYLRDAVARIGDIPLYAAGSLDLSLLGAPQTNTAETAPPTVEAPPQSSPAPAAKRDCALTPLFKFAGTLSGLKHKLTAFATLKNCSLQTLIEADEDDRLTAQIDFLCGNLKINAPDITLSEVHAHGSFAFDPLSRKIALTAPLRASAKTLNCTVGNPSLFDTWHITADKLDVAARLSLSENFEPQAQTLAVAALKVRADNFLQGGFPIATPIVELNDLDLANARGSVTLNATAFGSLVAAQADYDAATGTHLVLDTEIDFPQLLKVPQVGGAVPEEIRRKLAFNGKPEIRSDIILAPDFSFVRADYALDAEDVAWDGVKIDALSSYGTATPERLNIRLARASGERYCTQARIFFDFNPVGNYRVQVFGSATNPEVLDDYFDWFWWRIWNNLSVPASGPAPRVDIDVHGTTDENSRWEYIYGAIAGENAISGGVLIDKVSLRIAEEPAVISAFDIHVRHGDDRAAGSLQWHYAFEPEYHFRNFRFEFSGSMPPDAVFRVVGEGLPEIFDGVLEREASGTALARGFISGDERFYPDERVLVEVDVASAPGPFSFLGINAADFSGKINYDSGNVRIAPFFAHCDGGSVGGSILVCFPPGDGIDGTQVALDLALDDVPLSTLTASAERLKALGEDSPATPEKESTAEQAPDLSQVSARFKGALTLPELNSLNATGSFSLYDPALFNLHLLGGFSRFLETLKIPLTSFAFTNANTDFTIEDGKIYLPKLVVKGESGELTIRLNADITTQALEGDAVFKNKRFTQIPILGKVIDWASETTTLIPIGLSGSFDDIKWTPKPFSNLNPNRENPGEAPSNRRSQGKE